MRNAPLVLFSAALVFGGFCWGWAFGQSDPDKPAKFKVICEYNGGEVKDDICLKDNSVLVLSGM